MLAGAVAIIVQAPRCKDLPAMNWWNYGPLYQIDVEAFTESHNLKGKDLNLMRECCRTICQFSVGTWKLVLSCWCVSNMVLITGISWVQVAGHEFLEDICLSTLRHVCCIGLRSHYAHHSCDSAWGNGVGHSSSLLNQQKPVSPVPNLLPVFQLIDWFGKFYYGVIRHPKKHTVFFLVDNILVISMQYIFINHQTDQILI